MKGPSWRTHIVHGRNACGGASLKMWEDYFPSATLFGFDINPASYLNTERATTFVADQGDPGSIRRAADAAGGRFDIIVDDGSHRADHQQLTFSVLFDYLEPGGLYFIEDLMDNGDGDAVSDVFASNVPVMSTRRVFRSFAETGVFAGPNCIVDGGRIAAAVDWIHLHSPPMYAKLVEVPGGRRRRLIPGFVRDSEEIGVVRKRAPGVISAEPADLPATRRRWLRLRG